MNTALKLLLATIAVLTITIAPAAIEGDYMRRWGIGPDLEAAARTVQELPKSFGQWDFVQDGEPLSDIAISDLGIQSYTNRVYRNRQTGRVVTLLLMVGKPGPLVRHPPGICYANQNNRQIGGEEMLLVDGPPDSEFRLLQFRREATIGGHRFLVAYSHTADGAWQAPAAPRLRFGGEPLLFKVQALTALGINTDDEDRAGLRAFLDDFVASFHRLLDVN